MVPLHPRLKTRLAAAHKPKDRRTIPEWARDNIDFSRVPTYETPRHVKYDPNFAPYCIEPAEALTDPSVREVWFWKPARAGVSENLLFNPIRYTVAVDPQPTLYVSGDLLSTEDAMEKQIKEGFGLSEVTAEKLAKARALEHRIYFEDMDLHVAWPKNKMAFKQKGYSLILADEFSTWPEHGPAMMRKRTGTYTFSHICGVSSMDPQQRHSSTKDPIYLEFMETDQRYFFMPDPKTRKRFKFEMGGRDVKYGLKWSRKAKRKDGTWDLRIVKKTAHYVTPDGTKIKNKDRLSLVAKGKWKPTNPDGIEGRRGYHLNAFYVPFEHGDFGSIAVEFLIANRQGHTALRIFVYEVLSEIFADERESARDDIVLKRCREYKKGERMSKSDVYHELYINKTLTAFATVDVQKGHLWYLAREWIDGGDSGLIDYKYVVTWPDVESLANDHGVERVLVDCGYARRQFEVFEYCLEFGAWPTVGSDNIKMPFRKTIIDPFEGKVGAGNSDNAIAMYTFNTDIFKTLLMDMIRGESEKRWSLYNHIEHEYMNQLISEARVNGLWEQLRGHPNNHIWDCEVLQLLAATISGIYRQEWML